MRKLLPVILVLVSVLNLSLGKSVAASSIVVPLEVYQGDLILNDNNVTVVEGYFVINGSIYVEENATLILRNALINFTASDSGIYMGDSANGNPRLQAENTEIVGMIYSQFNDNSSATFLNVTGSAYFQFYDETHGSFVDSVLEGFQAREFSTVTVSNSTLQYVDTVLYHGNASVVNLSPGFVDHWDFQENCSVAFDPKTEAPDVVINQTTVNAWSFSFQGNSTASVAECELAGLHTNGRAAVDVYDSVIDTVELYERATADVYDSVADTVRLYYWTTATLTNTTYTKLKSYENSEAQVYWYLDVHVVDDSPTPGQSVESANVTVTFANGTMAGQALTDVDGWARLTLMEKTTNATGDHTVGDYAANATYLSYSGGAIVNMTESHGITLTLEGFIIPEFPTIAFLPILFATTMFAGLVPRRKHRKSLRT